MASTSLAGARADLYALLASNTTTGAPHASLTQITRVYDHEPSPGDLFKPVSVTIVAANIDPDFFTFEVRIYATDGTQQICQKNLDAAIDQVDARLRSTAEFGPSSWQISWIDSIAAWVALTSIMSGRQDYY